MFRSEVRFKANTEAVLAEIKARANRNVQAATLHMRNELIDKVNNAGDGREYPIRPETGRLEKVEIINKLGRRQTVRRLTGAKMHKASRPGDPPAVLRGQLKTSFQIEFEEDGDTIRGYVGPVNVPYAKALEFGFVGKDKNGKRHNLLPRPYMFPTYHEQRENLMNILRRGRIT